MPPNKMRNRPLSDPTLLMMQIQDLLGAYSPEDFINAVGDVFGSQHVILYGPSGASLADLQNRLSVLMEHKELQIVPWSIALNAFLSGTIDIGGSSIGIIFMPGAWTAADLTFQIGQWQNGSYWSLYDESGTEVVVTAAAARAIPLPPEVFGARWIKIRSGTVGTPVLQLAQRDGYLLLKG